MTSWPDRAQNGSGSNVQNFGGWSMGMAIEYGAGRIFIHGELASLTSIASGTAREGLHDPYAEDNEQYVLNMLRWLSGAL